MKIRTGFISNSSSTSYVVKFSKEPKSIQDVKDALLSKPFEVDNCYGTGNYSQEEIAKEIFERIQSQERNKFRELIDTYSFKGKEFYNMKMDIENNPDVAYYSFWFSSDDGSALDASLRFGNVFRNLKHFIEERS